MTSDTPDVEFSEPDFDLDLPHFEIFGGLAGETVADNVKHGIARSAFMSRLSGDPRAEDLWQKWGEWTGVNEAAIAVAKALEILATAAEVDTWEDIVGLFADEYSDESQAALQRLVENLNGKHIGDNVFQIKIWERPRSRRHGSNTKLSLALLATTLHVELHSGINAITGKYQFSSNQL